MEIEWMRSIEHRDLWAAQDCMQTLGMRRLNASENWSLIVIAV
jgi:hypothetical protein